VKQFIYSLSILFLVFRAFCAQSQDTVYARHIIDRLASHRFHGRGYVMNGVQKGADFIQSEFKKMNLKSYKSGFFQDFQVAVNTYPSIVELSIDGKKVIAGKEFLIDPASVSAHGSYPTHRISPAEINDMNKLRKSILQNPNKVLWIDDRKDSIYFKQERKYKATLENIVAGLPSASCPAILISSPGKLTWTIYSYLAPIPIFTVNSNVKTDSIKFVTFNVQNKFFDSYKTRNVIAYIKGRIKPDSIVLITAHYDHLGMMGKTAYFPGANDNASGIAMLLSLARYYSVPGNQPGYTMVFLALSAEELGLLGSQYFVQNPLFDLKSVKFLLNIDMAGNGDQGITVVNGTIYRDKFEKLQKINSEFNLLKQVKIRGEACNSDHCPFYKMGVPCFFIYTMGGVPYYHDVYDRSETLPLGSFTNYFWLLSKFIDSL
jgi:aminopeptidase YwaD